MRTKLVVVFILAFLIRLIALNQSLWLDEATTARVVAQYRLTQIVSEFSPMDFHPPGYYWLIKLWTGVFGYSETSLRFPSILFSLLAGYLVYLLGKKIAGEQIGLWAAIFFLFNPLIVYYSQEARTYMVSTFFVTLLLFSLIYSIKIFHPDQLASQNTSDPRKIFILSIYFILIFVNLIVFYGSIFFIGAVLIYLIYKKQYKVFLYSLLIIIFSLFILSPLLYQQINNARHSLKLVVNWGLVLGRANIKNLLLIPLKFSFGRISFYPKTVYYLLAGVWTVFIWYFVVGGGRKENELMIIMIITIITGLIFSFYSPLLQYFRFLYLIPIMSILISLGVKNSMHRCIIIGGFIILSLTYVLMPSFHREDWKGLTAALPKKATVYMITSISDPINYYRGDITVKEIRLGLPNKQTNILIIPYATEIYGYDWRKNLKAGYVLIGKQVFRGLELYRWKYF